LLAVALVAAFACGDAAGGPPPRRVDVTLTNAGCETVTAIPAGRVTFVVSNPSSSAVSSFVVESPEGQRHRLSGVLGGLTRELTVTLEPGAHTLECATGSQGGARSLTVIGG
jgi:hypothetical protein